MATKNEIDNRLSTLEESLMQSVRSLRSDLNVQAELLAKTRQDLDTARTTIERIKNVVDTMKNLQANYDVKTESW